MNHWISRFMLMLMTVPMLGIQPPTTNADEANRVNGFTVHGRLTRYYGNPLHRIWIVSTHRLLGVSESIDEVPSILKELPLKIDFCPFALHGRDFVEYRRMAFACFSHDLFP